MKDFLKRFLIFFSTMILCEIVFHMAVFTIFSWEYGINIFLLSIIVSCLLSLISGIFKGKGNTILTSIFLFVIGILFCIQIVFYNTFKVFFSFETLGLGDQLTSFLSETFQSILENIVYIIIFLLPFVLYLIFHKKLKLVRNNKICNIILGVVLSLSLGAYGLFFFLTKDNENSVYALYNDINSISLNMEKLGLLNAEILDIHRSVFGFNEMIVEEVDEPQEEEIVYEMNNLPLSFDKETSNKEIKTINEYMINNSGTEKNKYTGMFKDYNLIYIVAESFSEVGVSEELTPTLYRLTHSGFVFDKYYTPNAMSTIGGEFQALTGLYPDSSILSKWRSGKNYFPYGLGTVYRDLGYKTFAYHNNWYGFQDRHKYLKSQGFTNYIGCYNGMEKRMNCKSWPQSDLEMIKGTINDYIDADKFMAYYMTVSGHFQYNFSDNSMAYKNKKYVNDLKVSTAAKAYVATQIELDRALEYLINKLEEKDRLKDTVIVLLADHYPYKLSLSDLNSLSSYKRDQIVEANHNNLILWNSEMEDEHITKPGMSCDVLPTVYNLFGIDYDSRLFTGRDLLSNSEGLAVFNNRSWVSEYGTYFANQNKFDGTSPYEGYVEKMTATAKNRLNIGKLIVKNNYYNYLMK